MTSEPINCGESRRRNETKNKLAIALAIEKNINDSTLRPSDYGATGSGWVTIDSGTSVNVCPISFGSGAIGAFLPRPVSSVCLLLWTPCTAQFFTQNMLWFASPLLPLRDRARWRVCVIQFLTPTNDQVLLPLSSPATIFSGRETVPDVVMRAKTLDSLSSLQLVQICWNQQSLFRSIWQSFSSGR